MQTSLLTARSGGFRGGRYCQIAIVAVATSLMTVSGCSFRSRADATAQFIESQAQAWNRGDIDGFMRYYKKSDDITFSSGGQTRRGWQATSDYFKSRYDTKDKMGKLTFSDLEVTPLGKDYDLVLGRWFLDRKSPVGGNFSLIVERRPGGFKIIHDHTSLDAPK